MDGLQDVLPSAPDLGLADPLKIVNTIADLLRHGAARGLAFRLSSDFAEFARLRRELRGSAVSPLFDPAVADGLAVRGVWMLAADEAQRVAGLQAFRLDRAEPSLAGFAPSWMLEHYRRRREPVVPGATPPPASSRAHLVSGRVVYHGELWVAPRARGCFPLFPRLGLLLALVKWQPEAVWALTGQSMATRGHMLRMGYGHVEPGFLTWEHPPEGAEHSEWIGIALRRHLESGVLAGTI